MKNIKNILITGANGALAKGTIKHLLKDGCERITMACRSEQRGESAKKSIVNELGKQYENKLIVVGGFDMTEPDEIEKAVAKLQKQQSFDVVFLAAAFAVFEDDYQGISWNGKTVEKTIFQNLIGSHLVLKELKKMNLVAKGCRVVLAGGEGARGIPGMIEKPVFKSTEEFRKYIELDSSVLPQYNPMNAIGVSKLCGALWTVKMAELEKGNMDVMWFSPGLTSGSEGLKILSARKKVIMKIMFGVLGLLGRSQSPEMGGRKYADCLQGKIGENGSLLGAPKGKSIGAISDQTPMNVLFSDQDFMDEIWEVVEKK